MTVGEVGGRIAMHDLHAMELAPPFCHSSCKWMFAEALKLLATRMAFGF
jgi:hypothetical protein